MPIPQNVYLERMWREGSAKDTSASFCGIITISASGTEVQGPDISADSGFMAIGHPDNTNICWVMEHGAAKTSGYPISEINPAFLNVSNLSLLDFDAEVSGEKVCWIKV